MSFTVIAASPQCPSTTLAVATAAAEALADATRLNGGYQLVDLSVLSRRLLLPEPSAAVEDAVEQVLTADLILVASPAIKGTYSGLLKVFVDRLPTGAMRGAAALPLLVVDSPRDAAAVDRYLGPLLLELGAVVPAPGLAIDRSEPTGIAGALRRWAREVAMVLRERPREPVPAMAGTG